MDKQGKYDDIINLPHQQSKMRPHMSRYDRAAQFSPFAALTGYEDAVKEMARFTDEKRKLSEEMKSEINAKLALLQERIKEQGEQPEVEITYFLPDKKKSGGAYVTDVGLIKKIDDVQSEIIMKNQNVISMDDVFEITEVDI